MWVGEAGAGTRLKLATNSWTLAVVEGAAETLALTEGLGLDPALLFEALADGPLDLPYMRMKGQAITERNFEPSFRLALAAKDTALVADSASVRGLDLPLLSTIHQRLEQGAGEHGEKDMSATYLTSAPVAPRKRTPRVVARDDARCPLTPEPAPPSSSRVSVRRSSGRPAPHARCTRPG